LFIWISYTNKQRNPKTTVIHKKCGQVCERDTGNKEGKGGSVRLTRKETPSEDIGF